MNKPILSRFALLFDTLFGGLRWSLLLAPVLFALPGVARADAILDYEMPAFADTLTYEETLITRAPDETPAARSRQFGPFRVSAPDRVDMEGLITSDTPAAFAALLKHYPAVRMLVMHDCPGSEDDEANLSLSRMVRRAGLDTFVPATGSIRSGAVELFLAGRHRQAAPGAEIGVHSWVDEEGYEATDYPPSDPVHQDYIRYYVDMGMSPAQARAFYDFTNRAAPSSGVHYMSRAEVRQFGLTTDS
jgi:hypothetical protein